MPEIVAHIGEALKIHLAVHSILSTSPPPSSFCAFPCHTVLGHCALLAYFLSAFLPQLFRHQVSSIHLASLLYHPAPLSSPREGLVMPQLAFSYGSGGIHSMPVEILALIFVVGAAFDDPYADSSFLLKPDQEYKPVPSSNFQVIVSHVSSHWRAVALSTHSLWTTLHFRHPSHISRARTYLKRTSASAIHLLDILVETVSIQEHVEGSTLYKKELQEIFMCIVPQIKRWRTFHLKISDNDCKGIARLHLGTCGTAPVLETLQLYHFENYVNSEGLYEATYRPPVAIFNNSLPQLKNISLIGVNLQWDTVNYLTNLQNLELALHSENVRISYKVWNKMLRSCPDLKTLSLHYSGPKLATDDPELEWLAADSQHKIRLENLNSLNLTDLDAEYLCELIGRVSFPRLKRLTLELPEQDYSAFIELISGPPSSQQQLPLGSEQTPQTDALASANVPLPALSHLQFLVVHALECHISSWIDFLKAARGLKRLEADFARMGNLFWEVFTSNITLLSPTCEKSSKGKYMVAYKPLLLLPGLEVFKFTGVSGKDVVSALQYRHYCRADISSRTQEWIVGWTQRERARDEDLDRLITRGYWTYDEDEGSAGKVIISNYYDREEEEDEELEDMGEDDDDEDDG